MGATTPIPETLRGRIPPDGQAALAAAFDRMERRVAGSEQRIGSNSTDPPSVSSSESCWWWRPAVSRRLPTARPDPFDSPGADGVLMGLDDHRADQHAARPETVGIGHHPARMPTRHLSTREHHLGVGSPRVDRLDPFGVGRSVRPR